MHYSFAPLEGLTDHIYRRLHHKYFPGINRYFTPFLSPTVHRCLTSREIKELPPADSLGFSAVPQLLTKLSQDFLWMAEQCKDLGYTEINLNTGCPSGTVTAKGKGAGMLRDFDVLDKFLESVFSATSLAISVKTRIGFDTSEEFPALLEIFNRYPIKELIIHPRVRNAFYKGPVNMDAFTYAVTYSNSPVCYNGNLNSTQDIHTLTQHFPSISGVMLGRGLIGDPGMLSTGGTDRNTLEQFYGELLESYLDAFGGSRNAMFRLKEHWRYLLCKFEGTEKLEKRLRKTTDLNEYKSITQEIFRNLPMREVLSPDW